MAKIELRDVRLPVGTRARAKVVLVDGVKVGLAHRRGWDLFWTVTKGIGAGNAVVKTGVNARRLLTVVRGLVDAGAL